MNAKDQKKAIMDILNRRLIPSAIYQHNGNSYYASIDIIENVEDIKKLIKEL